MGFIGMFEDFLPKTYPENRPNTTWKADSKAEQKNHPEAPPEKLEIANKPVSMREHSETFPGYVRKISGLFAISHFSGNASGRIFGGL